MSFLTKKKATGGAAHPLARIGDRAADEPRGDGGPDEAAAFIAETVADLARLAQRHRLEMLGHLLEMAQLEAEEHVRLRSKRKLS